MNAEFRVCCRIAYAVWIFTGLLSALPVWAFAQQPPYDVFPPADPPYYRVRYEASTEASELRYAVNYTIWIPQDVKVLRGVVVHQHGCGEGSCKSGLTGAFDLHWQALAKKHDCALLAPAYEQPETADCQMWCDPRNGSAAAFQKCLVDLGAKSGHPELAKVPWALWGHSGGGHWAGGMVLLHPDRVVAAWLRSGVPLLKANPERPTIKAHVLPEAALKVPLMCNLGTKEGVTVKEGRFASVWPANETFFGEVRGKGGLIAVAVDPLTSHECGNQRYLAIPWLDACLTARLPKISGQPLEAMPTDDAWLATVNGVEAFPAKAFAGYPLPAAWLPNEAVARAWMQYVKDTAVADTTPPPAPTNVRVSGSEITWDAEADLESGLASFIIERDGQFLARLPDQGKNPFGRPIFQNLQYSDTPTQPLVPLRFTDSRAEPDKTHSYRVIAVNTVGLKSSPAVVPDQLPKRADTFEIDGHKAFVYAAPSPADGKPWLWYAPTLDGISLVQRKLYFDSLMHAGISIAGFDLGEVRGSPASTAKFSHFYDEMVKRGWSSKPILLGQSRGGMMMLAWAVRNPDKVRAFVGIYPVCNLASWPLKNSQAYTLADFAMTEAELIEKMSRFNPIDNLQGLLKNKVPMFAVHGDADIVVPYDENTRLLKERYEAGGGSITVKIIPGEGHKVSPSFFECQELVDFVLAT